MLAQSEVSQILCAEGSVRTVSDSRGDAFIVRHPAFPAELGLKSGQKWFGIHQHGGEEATRQLVESSLERWKSQFRAKSNQSLLMNVVLCSDSECSAVGAQTGEVHTCSAWNVIPSDSFEARLMEQSGAWAPGHSSEIDNIARVVRTLSSKRAMQQALNANALSSSPSASRKSKASKSNRRNSAVASTP